MRTKKIKIKIYSTKEHLFLNKLQKQNDEMEETKMTLNAKQIFLYAADDTDYSRALDIADNFNLPYGNVIGSFANAWTATAVGNAANNALYYNPCGFSGYASGSTPFSYYSTPRDTLPGQNYYMNAAGSTGTDSYDLAYAYVNCALNGNCSTNLSPISPVSTCIGRNPVNQNAASFGSTCDGSNTCGGNIQNQQSISDIESTAIESGWDPEAIAQTVLNLMSGSGVNIYGMDRYMAVAAMVDQGCYVCPTTCYQFGYGCDCSSPQDGQGFGVLQDTWSSEGRLDHSNTAINSIQNNSQSESAWFPLGINPCTVVADPGTAFAEFYWWALAQPYDNCETIPYWVVCPCSAACDAIQAYTTQTGNSCTYYNSGCSTICDCTS